jgi:ABC-type uncharacterized transport system permease subunit
MPSSKRRRKQHEFEIILHAGIATGTILLFASIGEILAERSGVMNLGVEGMMLLGAMTGFSVSLATRNPWLGLLAAMLAAGVLSIAHGVVTISFQADQVVSGLALTFLGTGLALVLGNGLTGQNAALIPNYDIAGLAAVPALGPIFFKDHSPLVYVGYLFAPLTWWYIEKTRPGMHLRAVGEKPEAADTMGVSVYGLRYLYVFIGGCLAGLAGATISLSVSPGWYSAQTTSGQGWIAVGLVIFAQWNPLRAAQWGPTSSAHCAAPSSTCRGRACCWALSTRSLSTPTWASSCRWLPTC